MARAKPHHLNLELLVMLCKVAAHGNISAAARELNVSSSLATRQVAALERTLGTRLFQRTTRSVKLTEAGQVALKWARQVVETYDEVSDDLASLAERPSGRIRLAVNHVATQYLPAMLQRFCRKYPEIQLSITTTDSLLNVVEHGFDLALHAGRIPDSSVIGIRVDEFRRVVCASPEYVARRGAPAQPEDLESHDCLVHATNEPSTWFFRRGRKLLSHPVTPYIDADTHLLLLDFARRGLGIARLGHHLVKGDLESGRLVELMPEYKSIYGTGELPGLWMVYPNRHVLHRTRLLIDFLSGELGARG